MTLPSPSRTVTVASQALGGLFLLSLLWAAGEGLARLLPAVPLTGSLWGMILLFLALSTGVLPEAAVRRASAALVRVLGLLFAPVGVGIVAYGPLVTRHAVAMIAAIVVGSLLTLLVAAGAAAVTSRRR